MNLIHQTLSTGPQSAEHFTLRCDAGIEAELLSYGATLMALRVPDRHGRLTDVVLGFDTLAGYLGRHPYFGSTVGRYANRIANGHLALDGQVYQLVRNLGAHHLHGGPQGLHAQFWAAQPLEADDGPSVTMACRLPAGTDGYPGTLTVSVTYTLRHTGALQLDCRATTDQATVVSLTNHSYFNLAGGGSILDHELTLYADAYLPTDATAIPTGEVRPVAGTPFDFRQPTPLGRQIEAEEAQLRQAVGYDHTFVLRHQPGHLGLAARLCDPSSGRQLDLLTTKPGVQLYTANHLTGKIAGKAGERYGPRSAVCLETQHFPDAPNQPHFPSPILRPGEVYRHTTIYQFTAR
ncbi:MAG: aldose epimerase family protein [Oscillochloridaceae bacterium umkhey_bin13]